MFTKKKLEEIWKRWSKKKEEQKASRSQQQTAAPRQNPQPKKTEPAKPVTNDMLDQLKMKFGK